MKKQADVVMLPTEKAEIGTLMKCTKEMLNNKDYKIGDLAINKNWKVSETNGNEYWQPQHLYFLSNDEIKEGDWCFDILNNITYQYKGGNNIKWNKGLLEQLKKIIATTDESLGLPRPSNEFLKKFCELGGVDKVLVEYEKESYTDRFTTTENGIGNPETWGNRYNLKVAPDNTITIYPIELC
jgi:hypothetical protein